MIGKYGTCYITLVILFILCGLIHANEEADFKTAPSAARQGEKVRIEFSVTAQTDAAVIIVKNDRIIRHLAAGALGKNPPAPLKPGLSQTLYWDGKDDLGKPVEITGCSVRIKLGLKPEFDRILGWKGEALGGIMGLTVDANGHIYVLSSWGKSPTTMTVFSREGKYIKTIMPYPADLPYEKVKHLGHIKIAEGKYVPIVRNPIEFSFYQDTFGLGSGGSLPPQTMALVGNSLVFSNAWSVKYSASISNRRLLIINKDGSVPENYLGPFLSDKHSTGHIHLAPAPDNKHVFASGLSEGERKNRKPYHVIYKIALNEKGPAKPYLGELNTSGSDKKHFNDPRGIGVDKHGNLYVADYGNNRIIVFNAKGGFLGQISVSSPGQLAIHQRTCAMYVHSGNKLIKLSPVVDEKGKWKASDSKGNIECSMEWRYAMKVFAVDGTQDPTVIWIGNWLGGKYGGIDNRFLLRIEEKDGKFGKWKPLLPVNEPGLITGGFLAVDKKREEVYVRNLRKPGGGHAQNYWMRIEGRTGKITQTKISAGDMAVGPEGNLYIVKGTGNYNQIFGRFDREGKPVPYKKTGTHILIQGNFLKRTFIAAQHCERGLDVAPNGEVYLLYPSYELKKPQTYIHCTAAVFSKEGELKRKHVIWSGNAGASLKVDYAGNMYVAENIKPKDQILPPWLKDKLPEPQSTGWLFGKTKGTYKWYPWMYGSVVKFPPQGGAVKIPMAWAGWSSWKPIPEWKPSSPEYKAPEPVEYASCHGAKAHVQNAVWVYTGISSMPAACGGCVCFGPRFDVDDFGRVFMPDAATCSIRVIDTNSNLITRFGEYGNMDSQGPDSTIPVPKIPFAWPQYIAVSHEAVYVSDVVNKRVIRVTLNYHKEKSLQIK